MSDQSLNMIMHMIINPCPNHSQKMLKVAPDDICNSIGFLYFEITPQVFKYLYDCPNGQSHVYPRASEIIQRNMAYKSYQSLSKDDNDGLVQERHNSIATTLELHLSWTTHQYNHNEIKPWQNQISIIYDILNVMFWNSKTPTIYLCCILIVMCPEDYTGDISIFCTCKQGVTQSV